MLTLDYASSKYVRLRAKLKGIVWLPLNLHGATTIICRETCCVITSNIILMGSFGIIPASA